MLKKSGAAGFKVSLLLLCLALTVRLSAGAACFVALFSLTLLALRLWAAAAGKPRTYFSAASISMLALVAPCGAIFGATGLLVAGLMVVVLNAAEALAVERSLFAGPFLFVIWAATLALLVVSFNLGTIVQVYSSVPGSSSISGLLQLFTFFRKAPPDWVLALESALRYLMLVCLYQIGMACGDFKAAFLRGLLPGLALAAIVSAISISGSFDAFFVNQSAIWDSLGRKVGSFTDPNAFGVFSALVLPLLVALCYQEKKVLSLPGVLLATWLILGSLSGSRTFFLAVLLYALAVLIALGRKAVFIGGAVLLLLWALLNLASFTAPEQLKQLTDPLPLGARRVISSLQVAQFSEAFFSRSAFWRIALQAWADHPLAGLGFFRFRNVAPLYAFTLALPTGVWTDNANSFYFGLAAELGILGLLAFVLAMIRLRFVPGRDPLIIAAKASLAVFLLLLIFGPHLEFDEIAILCAGLLSLSVRPQPASRMWLYVALLLVCSAACATLLKAPSLPYGFYRFEKTGDTYRRWTTGEARGEAQCSTEGKAALQVAAGNPDLPGNPLRVGVMTKSDSINMTLTSSRPLTVELHCSTAGIVLYRLKTSRVFIPATLPGFGADWRALGVQVLGLPEIETRPVK